MEDVGPFVVTGCDSTEVLGPVDGSLDLVAPPVAVAIEAGGPAAVTAFAPTVGPLVLRLRNRVLDVASSQVAPVAAGAVCLVAADMVGPGPRPSALRSGNPNPVKDLDHLRGVAPLARRE